MLWDAFFRRNRWERRLDAELRFHLDQQVRDYVANGMSREAAQRRAYREFGGIELAKEECRDQRPFLWLEHAVQDIRYALRLLARNRTFSVAAILSLALGIGATTSVFSVVDRILFRSLPYSDADRLVSIGVGGPMLPYDFMFGASYLEFRRHQTAFSAVTSWSGVNDCDLTSGEPIRLQCASVESSFLGTLGIVPALGRSFTAEEDGPNKPRTVLLSYGVWQSRFARPPGYPGAHDFGGWRTCPRSWRIAARFRDTDAGPSRSGDPAAAGRCNSRARRHRQAPPRDRPIASGNDHRGGAGGSRCAGRPCARRHAAWGAGARNQAACQNSARSPDWRCQSCRVGPVRLGAGGVASGLRQCSQLTDGPHRGAAA